MEDRHYKSRSKLTWLEHLSIVREPRSVRSGIKFLVTHARHRPAIDYKVQHSIDMNLQNADVAAHAVRNLLVEHNAEHDNKMPLHADGVCRRVSHRDGGSPVATGDARESARCAGRFANEFNDVQRREMRDNVE